MEKISQITLGGQKIKMASVVLVTGASSGLGAEIAKLLSENEYKVVLGARRLSKIQEVIESSKNPENCTGVEVDVTSREQVRQFVARGREIFGSVDILVSF